MKILALDIGGTSIKAAVWNEGNLSDVMEYETNAERGGAYVMERACNILKTLGSCDGIGVSTAGQVDEATGSIRYANENIPGYTGIEVRRILEEYFHVPVAVENDVNAAAIGEGYYGAAQGYKDYICLTYGTGVGGAIVIDNRVIKGFSGSAGEVGSMIVHGHTRDNGIRPGGCYEYYASTKALVQKAFGMDVSLKNGRQIFERINEPAVQDIVDEWVWEISHGLVSLIHIFNPGCIILGGGIMNQDYVVNEVLTVTKNRIMPSFKDVEFKRAKLGNTAGLWGAIHLVLKAAAD